MDPRHSLIVILLSGGCVEVDYATPCPDCSSHGLSTDGELLATYAGAVSERALAYTERVRNCIRGAASQAHLALNAAAVTVAAVALQSAVTPG